MLRDALDEEVTPNTRASGTGDWDEASTGTRGRTRSECITDRRRRLRGYIRSSTKGGSQYDMEAYRASRGAASDSRESMDSRSGSRPQSRDVTFWDSGERTARPISRDDRLPSRDKSLSQIGGITAEQLLSSSPQLDSRSPLFQPNSSLFASNSAPIFASNYSSPVKVPTKQVESQSAANLRLEHQIKITTRLELQMEDFMKQVHKAEDETRELRRQLEKAEGRIAVLEAERRPPSSAKRESWISRQARNISSPRPATSYPSTTDRLRSPRSSGKYYRQ